MRAPAAPVREHDSAPALPGLGGSPRMWAGAVPERHARARLPRYPGRLRAVRAAVPSHCADDVCRLSYIYLQFRLSCHYVLFSIARTPARLGKFPFTKQYTPQVSPATSDARLDRPQ
jgi:hypothetical protein